MKEVSALQRADNLSTVARTGSRAASRDNGDFATQMGAQRAAFEQRTAAEQRAVLAQRDAQRTDAMRDDARRETATRTDATGSMTRSVEANRAEESRTAAMRAMSRRAATAAQDATSAGPAQSGAVPRALPNNIESGHHRLANRSNDAAERGDGRAQAGRPETGRAGRPAGAAEAADARASEPDRAADASEPGAAKRRQADRAAPTQAAASPAATLGTHAAALLAPWTQRAAASAASMQETADPGKTGPDAVGKDARSARSDRSSAQAAPPTAASRANASDFGNPLEALPGARGADRAGGAASAGRAATSSGSDAATSFAGALASAHAAATSSDPALAEQPAPPIYTVQEPVGTPQFAPAMSERVVAMLSEGIQTARITVSPPELGPVRIEVSLSGELASVAFSALQPDTRLAIEQSLPVLGEMLAERGLRLDHTQVDSGAGSFAQSGHFDQPGGSNEPQRHTLSGNRAAMHAADDDIAAMRTVNRAGRIGGSDRLDVFA